MGDPSWTTRFLDDDSEPKDATRAKIAEAIKAGCPK